MLFKPFLSYGISNVLRLFVVGTVVVTLGFFFPVKGMCWVQLFEKTLNSSNFFKWLQCVRALAIVY